MPEAEGRADLMATAESLHQLALRYWADERASDAHRVEKATEAMLREHGLGPDLQAEVASTLRGLEAELGIARS